MLLEQGPEVLLHLNMKMPYGKYQGRRLIELRNPIWSGWPDKGFLRVN